jgi:hypothetical protein
MSKEWLWWLGEQVENLLCYKGNVLRKRRIIKNEI